MRAKLALYGNKYVPRSFCFLKILWNLFWHNDKNVFSAHHKLTFEILQGTRLVSTLKKSSPTYVGPKISTPFWCTGWAWNRQIISIFASIHGRACFILLELYDTNWRASNILLLASKKYFLSKLGLEWAGMNCRALCMLFYTSTLYDNPSMVMITCRAQHKQTKNF